MTFGFRRYAVAPSPAYPSEVIDRPVIPIRVAAGGLTRPLFALVDTGSDDTKMPISVAESLGVRLDRSHPVLFRGVGGTTVGFYGEVTLELRHAPRRYRWSAHVAFLPDLEDADPEERVTVTLGHAGFFRVFHVSLDYQRHRVRIRPNGLFEGLGVFR